MIYPIVSSISYILISYILKLNKLSITHLYKTNKAYNKTLKIIGAIYNMIMAMCSLVTFVLLSLSWIQEYGTMIKHNVCFSERSIEHEQILNICWIYVSRKHSSSLVNLYCLKAEHLVSKSSIKLERFGYSSYLHS